MNETSDEQQEADQQGSVGENVETTNGAPQSDSASEGSAADAAESADELCKAKTDIERLERELSAANDKYLRALADSENYKKRALKERSDLLKYQGEQLVLDLIRVVDDLDLATQYKDADPEKVKEGLGLIYKSLRDVLSKWDIRSESAVGKDFDPVKHSAISKVPAQDAAPGTVVSELKKAFYYKDKLIRPAEVVVAVEASS